MLICAEKRVGVVGSCCEEARAPESCRLSAHSEGAHRTSELGLGERIDCREASGEATGEATREPSREAPDADSEARESVEAVSARRRARAGACREAARARKVRGSRAERRRREGAPARRPHAAHSARAEAARRRSCCAGAERSRHRERRTRTRHCAGARAEATVGARVAPVGARQRRGGACGCGQCGRRGGGAGQWAGPRTRLVGSPDACAESVEGAQREAGGGGAGALVVRERTHEETRGGHLRLRRAARQRCVVVVQRVAGEAAGRRSAGRRADTRAVRLVRRRERAVALAVLQERHGGHLQEVHEGALVGRIGSGGRFRFGAPDKYEE